MSDSSEARENRNNRSSDSQSFDEKELEISRERGRSFLYEMVCEIVDRPEDVTVTQSTGDRTTVYKVNCHPKNLGQLIGSKGKNISGIRAVISAMMARRGIRAIVEIPYIDPHAAE
jgi:predicted RNA-binding protein YlqC (UPF0109 family)